MDFDSQYPWMQAITMLNFVVLLMQGEIENYSLIKMYLIDIVMLTCMNGLDLGYNGMEKIL